MQTAPTRKREIAWAIGVGVVLADSSIVTLALPEILGEYGTSVFGVSWVLTAYNLVLALAVLPCARLARRRPGLAWALGTALFAGSSLVAALSGSLALLIVARCLQALGGAALVSGAIELLASSRGSHAAAARFWGAAGTAGLVTGPALGGALTELLSWQSIFVVQVPLVALAAVGARAGRSARRAGSSGTQALQPEAALALVSAGLTAALFLLVVLLVEGWGLSPIGAAATVSVIPAATLAAGRLGLARAGGRVIAAAGAVATAGGLAALGLIPGAAVGLTLPPQVLIGAGLALALPVLTAAAVGGPDPLGSRAAGTIAARHLGIVIGIVALTPILSSQLEAQHTAGRDAGTALLLDSPLRTETKLRLGERIASTIDAADGRLPEVGEAFADLRASGDERVALDRLEAGLQDQLERAATHAFTWPFIGAAAFAALALLPIRRLNGRRPLAGVQPAPPRGAR